MGNILKFTGPSSAPALNTDHDLVSALEALTADARAGRLHYIAFVAQYEVREYLVDIVGETDQAATIKRMVDLLAASVPTDS